MAAVNPYLNFNGNCEEAFDFYRSVLGGEYMGGKMRFKDVPAEHQRGEEEANKIMHVALPIGDSVLMGSDIPDEFGQATLGQNFAVSYSADSREQADKVFQGLSAGGQVTMPMSDAFWGSYFGMFTDKFGIQWMVSAQNKM